MKTICFAILLCFLFVSCAGIPSIAIISITGIAATGIVDTVKSGNDFSVPSFRFPEDVNGEKYVGIGADIKVYSDFDSAEWRSGKKYRYIIGDISLDGPAERAGIKRGDTLYGIGGRLTEGMRPCETFSYFGEEIIVLYVIDGETGLLRSRIIKEPDYQ